MITLKVTRWNMALAGGTVMLGMLFSLGRALPITYPAGAVSDRDISQDAFADSVKRLEDEQKALKAMVDSLEKKLQTFQQAASKRRDSLAEMGNDLEKQKMLAGMVAVAGSGLKVVLDDSTKQAAATDDPGHYLIHDYHLRDVLSSLWSAGAEAVSINGERIVSSTSIYCVGTTLLINNTPLSPPYEISAIGNADTLEGRLNAARPIQSLRGEARQYGLQFIVQKLDKINIPAFSGVFSPKYSAIGSNK